MIRSLCLSAFLLGTALPAAALPGTALPEAPAAVAATPAPLDATAIEVEVLRLRAALQTEVPKVLPRSPVRDVEWEALARAQTTAAGFAITRPQLLVVVDRNTRVQELAVMLAMPTGDWKVIGSTKVSTGSTGRFDHYVTPLGVFRVTDAILGFRAEGTQNENGIRGLGSKGMRVWDFGWQVAMKGWAEPPGKPDRTPIRLMMHATDPDKLEQRIGRTASQGCVRIPSAMNRFLDQHGVIDAEYEKAAVTDIRFRALLPVGRTPSPLAGSALVVVESVTPPPAPKAPSLTVANHTAS